MNPDRRELAEGDHRPLPDSTPESARRQVAFAGLVMVVFGVALSALGFGVNDFGREVFVAGISLVVGGAVIVGVWYRGWRRQRAQAEAESTASPVAVPAGAAGTSATPTRYRCPHCGGAALDGGFKLQCGPSTVVRCARCGEDVRVSGYSYAGLLPGIAAIAGLVWVEPIAIKVPLMILGVGSAVAIHLYAPLVRR